MRLGEILLAQGLVTGEQVDKALRTQSALAGRFGTNMIELGFVDPDTVANALARQKGVPAARLKFFEAVDKSLTRLLPRHVAERLNAIPVGIATKFGKELVVAFQDPDEIQSIDEVSFVTGSRVRPCVAPEFYVIHFLERLYGISPRRYLRSAPIQAMEIGTAAIRRTRDSGGAAARQIDPSVQGELTFTLPEPSERHRQQHTPPQQARPQPAALAATQPQVQPPQPVQLAETRATLPFAPQVQVPEEPPAAPPAPAKSARTTAASFPPPPVSVVGPTHERSTTMDLDAGWEDMDVSSFGAEQPEPEAKEEAVEEAVAGLQAGLDYVVADGTPEPLPESLSGLMKLPPEVDEPKVSREDAISEINAARDKDSIADAVVRFLRSAYGSGLVLICKKDIALGWKGFAPDADSDAIESVSIPLTAPSMFQEPHRAHTVFLGAPPSDGADLQLRLWKLLRSVAPAEVVVAPVMIKNRVINLIYAHATHAGELPDTARDDITAIAAAASDAYVRIIQQQKS